MSVDGFIVGKAIGVTVIVGLGLGLGLAADDVAHRVDADLPAIGLRAFADIRDVTAAFLQFGEGREQEVAILGREVSPGIAERGVHRDGSRRLNASRAADDVLESVILAFEVERRVGGIGALDDLEPFARLVVAALDEFDPEHREFARIPSADDVQPGAAATDVIDGRERLGGIERMQKRDVNGHENPDPLGDGG